MPMVGIINDKIRTGFVLTFLSLLKSTFFYNKVHYPVDTIKITPIMENATQSKITEIVNGFLINFSYSCLISMAKRTTFFGVGKPGNTHGRCFLTRLRIFIVLKTI